MRAALRCIQAAERFKQLAMARGRYAVAGILDRDAHHAVAALLLIDDHLTACAVEFDRVRQQVDQGLFQTDIVAMDDKR